MLVKGAPGRCVNPLPIQTFIHRGIDNSNLLWCFKSLLWAFCAHICEQLTQVKLSWVVLLIAIAFVATIFINWYLFKWHSGPQHGQQYTSRCRIFDRSSASSMPIKQSVIQILLIFAELLVIMITFLLTGWYYHIPLQITWGGVYIVRVCFLSDRVLFWISCFWKMISGVFLYV